MSSSFFKKINPAIVRNITLTLFVQFLFYKDILSVVYGYAGFHFVPNTLNIINSSVFFLVMVLFTASLKSESKKFYLGFILAFLIVPILLLYCFNPIFQRYTAFVMMCFASFLAIGIVLHMQPLISFKKIRVAPKIIRRIFFIFVIGGIIISLFCYIWYCGVRIFNLDFSKVYTYRLLLYYDMPKGFLAYLNTWSFLVLNPVAMIFSLKLKRYLLFALTLILQVVFFGFSSAKIAVLLIPLLLMGYWGADWILSNAARAFAVISGGVFSLVCFPYFIGYRSIFAINLFRRAFWLPAKIAFESYEYFSQHSFAWFRHSFLRHLVLETYPEPSLLLG